LRGNWAREKVDPDRRKKGGWQFGREEEEKGCLGRGIY